MMTTKREAEKHFNALFNLIRIVYALIEDRPDESSKRLRAAIANWISENG